MISWGASEGSHINALAAFHDDARYWYFSNLLVPRSWRARAALLRLFWYRPRDKLPPGL
jgi:hypothetical protein